MKSVLISIRPKWVEKIASGEKTIEVRRTAPKCGVPFKAYIYETKESKRRYLDDRFNSVFSNKSHYTDMGKVIGEFICDKIDKYNFHEGLTEFNSMGLPSRIYGSYLIFADDYKAMCLSYNEVKNYGEHKTLYGWHISDLTIYDSPKELSAFYRICKNPCKPSKGKILCLTTKSLKMNGCDGKIHLTRPPQSWQYVEEL